MGGFSGAVGQVRRAWHLAATVRDYAITRAPDGERTVRATVVRQDAFQLSQRPLAFVVALPTGREWRWPMLTCDVAEGRLTATLGPPDP